MPSIDTKTFKTEPGKAFKIAQWPTSTDLFYEDKADYRAQLRESSKKLHDLQHLLAVDGRYAVLLIFQAMDAGGKDGVIRHVMSGVNPQGCQVTSFKAPSLRELNHDFLWRTTKQLPQRGHLGIFNRSYYEEVLIAKVRPHILAKQNLPDECLNSKKLWQQRHESINDLEKHLHRNGTRIVKFFLHLSPQEQKKRFIARIDNPEKHWKIDPADIAERTRWDEYQTAYEETINLTNSNDAPWFVIPADNKRNCRLIVSQVVQETLKSLPLSPPETSEEQVEVLKQLRADLAEE